MRTLLRWCLLGVWAGTLSGLASALFLALLARATALREAQPTLLWGLPLAGALLGWTYHRFGASVEAGSNLLLERLHEPGPPVPFRMAPLILFSTVVTHLFGGSAGREGTAVQLGGALASLAPDALRLSAQERRLLLQSGISGGFGSVFGTPLAGAVFALEVPTVGVLRYEGLVPCFVAAVVGDLVCRGLGAQHAHYPAAVLPPLTGRLWLWVLLAGVLFGSVSALFLWLTHAVQRGFKRLLPSPWGRPLVGGGLLVALTLLVGSRDYLGLSLPLLARSFTPGGVVLWAFALKLVFTALTLGTGFKGGEVTPLFCIGATLGAALAPLTGNPTAPFAALGFVAVFGAAAKTPLACLLLGIELFGAPLALPLAATCLTSYAVSGKQSLYSAQRRVNTMET